MGRAGSPVLLQDLALHLSASPLGAGECVHVFYEAEFTVPVLCLSPTL